MIYKKITKLASAIAEFLQILILKKNHVIIIPNFKKICHTDYTTNKSIRSKVTNTILLLNIKKALDSNCVLGWYLLLCTLLNNFKEVNRDKN